MHFDPLSLLLARLLQSGREAPAIFLFKLNSFHWSKHSNSFTARQLSLQSDWRSHLSKQISQDKNTQIVICYQNYNKLFFINPYQSYVPNIILLYSTRGHIPFILLPFYWFFKTEKQIKIFHKFTS